MMPLIHWCLRLLLNDSLPKNIGWALMPAFTLAVFPVTSLQWGVALLSIVLVRFNLASLCFGTLFFWSLSGFMDPFAHNVGNYILTQAPGFSNVWPRLFHAPILPYTLFNHTTVMGYFVFFAAIPLLCLTTASFCQSFAGSVVSAVMSTDLWQSFASSRFYRKFSQYLRYENR